MFDIVITDNRSEMTEIGRMLFRKRRLFTKNQVNVVKDIIHRFMPFATEEERENFFFQYYYDYMVYGFAADQEFYYKAYKKTHKEKSTYLTQQNRFLYYSRLNKRSSMHILEDKYEAYQLLKDYYKRDIIKIVSVDDYPMFEDFIKTHSVFVAKPIDLSNGLGVRKVVSTECTDKYKLFEELLGVGAKFEQSQDYKWFDIKGTVLEEIIQQDESINKLNPTSVNGVRITTIRIGNDVHIYYPWIKVGSGGEFIVSAILGGFDACINAGTGIVETDGVMESGRIIQYHPDTHIKIKGFQIPYWDQLIDIAKEVANKLDPSINYVGWDFVLTPNGWVIMEGNFYGDVMWQMCYDKGMKEDLEELIGWKPEKQFWWQYSMAELER